MILFVKRKGMPGVGGSIILEWILKNRYAVYSRLADSEYGLAVRCREYGNDLSVLNILTDLRNSRVSKINLLHKVS